MTAFDILSRAEPSLVKTSPYPYIVIDNALPQEEYDLLSSTYPDPEAMSADRKQKNNHRYNLLSKWGATEFPFEEASDPWKQFTETNTSPEFVRKVYDLFPDYTAGENGSAGVDLSNYGPELHKKIKVDPTVPFAEVIPRVTVAVNTPVTEVSSVRGAHTDNIRKAYVGLLYFRLPGDDSTGGNLEVSKWKDGVAPRDWATAAKPEEVDILETVEYHPNRLILFLTTNNALHGVSPRSITPHWRRLVVISGWFPGVDYYDTDTMHGAFSGIKANIRSLARRALGKASVSAD